MMQMPLKINAMAFPVLFLIATLSPHQNKQAQTQSHLIHQAATCAVENQAFKDGETITYKLYYNWNFVWLSAGEVQFKVKELDDQFHFSAVGTTYKSYEWFFKVRDYYESYVDKKTLLPEVSVRDVEEGKYRLYDRVTFDQDKGKAFSLRGKSKETAEMAKYDIDPCMHDVLSMVYFLRNVDITNYKKGDALPLKVFMDKESWPLKMTYAGKEEDVKVKGLGRFNTIRVSPEVIAGDIFDDDTEMNIWVTDDKNRLPLLIESPLSVGSVKAVLKDYKNLRHDLRAEVK
ncbi:DUF3108 domain-containing protein [Phaeodactylibacter xiamenensis]|uniref:DUF3108 domain-containing protein n=1 Tax=Phaeodactylibacter xiamenensis TaxID=1524460 RepID=UPI0024A888F3|nr:DUF3108 domain-containing protein [Phaeodactylibacter xiamenensis]